MMQRVSVGSAQRRLGWLWGLSGGGLFLLLFLQCLIGKYGEDWKPVWTWFVPLILPSAAVLVGAYMYTANHGRRDDTVDRGALTLSMAMSALHLVMVLAVIFVEPFSPMQPTTLMQGSQYLLAFTQALSGAALSGLFVSQGTEVAR